MRDDTSWTLAPDPDTGDAYAAVEPGASWGLASLLFFVAALGARHLVGLLPGEMAIFPYRSLASAFAVPGFAGVGLLLGFLGLRSPQGRGLARLGIFVNGVALVLGFLLLAAFFYILPES